MGLWVQAILDRETTTREQAQELAATMVAWLADRRIIEDRQCDACFGDGPCYPPGSAFRLVCAGTKSEDSDDDYSNLSLGMRVVTEPDFLYDPNGNFPPVPCPACGQEVDSSLYMNAGGDWIMGGPGILPCPHCGVANALPRWVDPRSGFVMLGFEFFDWPTFSPEFVEEFAKRLGHRVTHFAGKR